MTNFVHFQVGCGVKHAGGGWGCTSPPHYTLAVRTNGIEGDGISNVAQLSAIRSHHNNLNPITAILSKNFTFPNIKCLNSSSSAAVSQYHHSK
jgi:hypothetical protein